MPTVCGEICDVAWDLFYFPGEHSLITKEYYDFVLVHAARLDAAIIHSHDFLISL